MSRNSSTKIRAAGGLIVRGDSPDTAELLLVHRPEYDDWSLPKGKHDRGESSSDCAVREVWEETGFRCRIVDEAGVTRYRVRDKPKEVDYFLMRPYRSTEFRPNHEVDAVSWVSVGQALGMLTYDFDRELVSALSVEAAVAHTTVHLVRHAKAGNREGWEGPDRERPLTTKGLAQSKALAGELSEVGVTRILTSPYLRCVQTVEPLADHAGVAVESTDHLAEGAGPTEIDRLMEEMSRSTVVLCSHGDVIPAVLERLEWMGVRFMSPYKCKKGSTWVVGYDGQAFIQARYVRPPTV